MSGRLDFFNKVCLLLSTAWDKHRYHVSLRHDDDHEVHPVPRVSEEGEPADTEASGHHLDEDLQRVYDREHDSVIRGGKESQMGENKLLESAKCTVVVCRQER